MRNLRSLLSTPGNRPAMLEKALASEADALIVDLEDSVPAAERPQARVLVRELIDAHGGEAVVYVRVNPAGSAFVADDVEAIVAPGLVGVQLPKADSPEDVLAVAEARGMAVVVTGKRHFRH